MTFIISSGRKSVWHWHCQKALPWIPILTKQDHQYLEPADSSSSSKSIVSIRLMWIPGSSKAADATGSSWSATLGPSAASLSDLRRSISCRSSVLMTLSRWQLTNNWQRTRVRCHNSPAAI